MMLKNLSTISRSNDDVLGINARNLDYIYQLNSRKYFKRVDDKLITKKLLQAHSIPTPPTLAVFRNQFDLRNLQQTIAPFDGFALKPSQGSGGRGIMVARRDTSDQWVVMDKKGWIPLDLEHLKMHIGHILSGLYSLENLFDTAFLEQLLIPIKSFKELSNGGIPDIRIIVHRGQPIMAMTRFPTRQSRGRSNLHQGAFAFGINMQNGQTTSAVWRNRNITDHPDTGKPLPRLEIPDWETILDIAGKAARCTELDYLGADIVIDKKLGPVVIELNARPGLSIQLANRMGLVKKLHGGKMF